MTEENMAGPGWEIVRPRPARTGGLNIDALVPNAPWFWHSLERFCVPGCCGLDAYNFDEDSVRWACGTSDRTPEGNDWRDDHPGDPMQLASELRQAAVSIRAMKADTVDGSLFLDPQTPEAYALLFIDLADIIEATEA